MTRVQEVGLLGALPGWPRTEGVEGGAAQPPWDTAQRGGAHNSSRLLAMMPPCAQVGPGLCLAG